MPGHINKRNLLIGGVLLAGGVLLWSSCKTMPKGASVVSPFDAKKYAGKWYEIARLDFRFEKNLNNTTAMYTLNDDGTIRVVNRGFNVKTKEYKEAVGKAKFRGSPNEGKLKVSFFGPFYSGYNVLALDPDYKYALIAGKNLKYLWLLSRTTDMPEDVRKKYLAEAESLGYDTSALVWVEHNQ